MGNQNPEQRQNIGLQIDDQTGTILSINLFAEGFFENVSISGVVSEFASVYMNSIALRASPSTILCEGDSVSESYVVYEIGDQLQEVVQIEFYMDSNGCSTKMEKMQS